MNRFRENFFGGKMSAIKKQQEDKRRKMELAFRARQKEMEKNSAGAIKKGGEVKEEVEDFLFGNRRRGVQGAADMKTQLLLAKQAAENKFEDGIQANSPYAFQNGGLLQQNYLEMQMKKQKGGKVKNMEEQFKKKVEEIKNTLKIYDQKWLHKENVSSMNNTIQGDTDKMAEKASFGLNTRNINNRMADWYDEQNEFYEWINSYLSKLYWLVVLGALVLIYMKFKFKNKKALGIICGFIIAPFILNNLIYWIFGLNSNNCPTYVPSLGFEAGGSKTCQSKKAIIPVDCVMGAWTRCNKRCGGGTQTREIEMEAMHGGKACGHSTQKCNTERCEPGENPTEPKKGIVVKKGDENVLIEMTKGLWQSFQSRLDGAKEKSESDMCRQQEQDKYDKKQADLFSGGADKIKGIGGAAFGKAGDLFGKAKNMGANALNKTKNLVKDPKGTLNKLTDSAEDAIKKGEAAIKTSTDKTDKYFNITSAPCVGKYCR